MPQVYPNIDSCNEKTYFRLKEKYKNGLPYNPGSTKSSQLVGNATNIEKPHESDHHHHCKDIEQPKLTIKEEKERNQKLFIANTENQYNYITNPEPWMYPKGSNLVQPLINQDMIVHSLHHSNSTLQNKQQKSFIGKLGNNLLIRAKAGTIKPKVKYS